MKANKEINIPDLFHSYDSYKRFEVLLNSVEKKIFLKGFSGSALSVYHAAYILKNKNLTICILPDKETAAFYYSDLTNLLKETNLDLEEKKILFFPNSFVSNTKISEQDNLNILSRIEVIKRIALNYKQTVIISYPEAIAEKSISPDEVYKNNLVIKKHSEIELDEILNFLSENNFERVEFTIEPGQFSLRGSILDIYSFCSEYPFRVEFSDDKIESIRSYHPSNQLSINNFNEIAIFSINSYAIKKSIIEAIPEKSMFFISDLDTVDDKINKFFENTPENFAINSELFNKSLLEHKIIFNEFNTNAVSHKFNCKPQIDINKNFDLLFNYLITCSTEGKTIYICSETESQIARIKRIIDEILADDKDLVNCNYIVLSLHQGFIDEDNLIVLMTDHQIFNRYHKYSIKDRFDRRQNNTIKELSALKPGDYITHIDYGIGKFDGIEKINNNGTEQEAIRIVYANNDLLYVNIHSLYKISKYANGEGHEPKLNRLGSNAWNALKSSTKKKVKDIAQSLIKLYAERKSSEGFSFSADSYLQNQLEASFMFEDTPDQLNATLDVKNDMEKPYPMERLICGDVGFGKTEIAIRAAFKAAADSKQVIVLVPTTILAMQHYQTFSARLKDFPVTIDYLSRFRSAKEQKLTKDNVAKGKIDILIGTHILLSNSIKFKDLGLLIIDEEQKFGVSAKEKIKELKTNIDTLTLSATPIPRTLQFSLMGARDMSILQTPPNNRQPVQTEICYFNDEIIKQAINYEIDRGGQVFFVHNRIQNIQDVANMLLKLLPGISIATAHGQMEGKYLEKIMMDFINGKYDILLTTKIIESGLDIPNVNTIIINEANYYGLSELHQLRGRVGRSNKKAFCYLISPPPNVLTEEARKRLKAIEELSELGSGFNIAMRDLDIRGAGNILGAEQSGFISDIGFEVYQKILNEALSELKASDSATQSNNVYEDYFYTSDCQIDTDIEALIPDEYISNIKERMQIYREINDITDDNTFIECQIHLRDRFGVIPPQVINLFDILKIKLEAKKLGIERIIIKNNILKFYFLSSENKSYYESDIFDKILSYVKDNPNLCRVGDKNNRMTLELIKKHFTLTELLSFLKTFINES